MDIGKLVIGLLKCAASDGKSHCAAIETLEESWCVRQDGTVVMSGDSVFDTDDEAQSYVDALRSGALGAYVARHTLNLLLRRAGEANARAVHRAALDEKTNHLVEAKP